MMDCIEPNQTVYLYHPSINDDTDLLQDYHDYYGHFDSDRNNVYHYSTYSYNEDHEDEDVDDQKSPSFSRAMSMSYQSHSYQSTNGGDIDEHMQHIDVYDTYYSDYHQPHKRKPGKFKKLPQKELTRREKEEKDLFFTSLNLYYSYIGNKYGLTLDVMSDPERTKLVQITHSILIWALRKMDDLWKQKASQEKLQKFLKYHAFPDQDIIDIVMFGNKLTDQNAKHLITYRYIWYICSLCPVHTPKINTENSITNLNLPLFRKMDME